MHREARFLIFYYFADSATRPATKLTKLYNCEYKIRRRFTQSHKLMIKLAMCSNICLAFNLYPRPSCSNDYGVPCKFAQATRSSLLVLGNLSSSVFELRTSTKSEPFFSFNMLLRYQIFIAKCLYSHRDDLTKKGVQNHGSRVQKVHFRLKSAARKRRCLSFLLCDVTLAVIYRS